MNDDLVYEILQYFYLCPEENAGAIVVKKTILAQKLYSDLEQRKMDKPIVLSVLGRSADFRSSLSPGTIVYWGDGSITKTDEMDNKHLHHTYNYNSMSYGIKIFGQKGKIVLPISTVNVHSIGELTDLSYLLMDCFNLHPYLGRKWDTSGVKRMWGTFYGCLCIYVDGRNWDTSKVIDMRGMFHTCLDLNRNVGKYWDTSNVVDMSGMFHGCQNLDQPIGGNWDISSVKNMSYMFYDCQNLDQPIGKNWDICSVKDMSYMFHNCKKLTYHIGQN